MFSSLCLFLLCVLINIAFVTLFERKILGLSQYRRGPNKVGGGGVLQPLSDAVKLFLKFWDAPYKGLTKMFLWSPLMALGVMLILWIFIPGNGHFIQILMNSVFIIMLISLNIYPLLIAGWASNSKLSMIGSLRGVAQTISYEISFALIIFSLLIISGRLSLSALAIMNMKMIFISAVLIPWGIWLISCVAETNRAPLDFAEGESELVSGFNVEYGGAGFAILFMAEYGMIMYFSGLTTIIFFNINMFSLIGSGLVIMVIFFWMWIRSSFPRFRYDKLMNLCWKFILPISLFMIFLWKILN